MKAIDCHLTEQITDTTLWQQLLGHCRFCVTYAFSYVILSHPQSRKLYTCEDIARCPCLSFIITVGVIPGSLDSGIKAQCKERKVIMDGITRLATSKK